MRGRSGNLSIWGGLSMFVMLAVVLDGCNTIEGKVGVGATAFTLWGARTPAQEVEVTYYLGMLDPEDQLPPQMYRVRVHGQASLLSAMKFASAWVPAEVVDSLSSEFITGADKAMLAEWGDTAPDAPRSRASAPQAADGATAPSPPPSEEAAPSKEPRFSMVPVSDPCLEMNRRLLLFGPEGFRVAPAKHRLVIVMGASPDKYFDALHEALAEVKDPSNSAGRTQQEQVVKALLDDLTRAQRESAGLNELTKDARIDIEPTKEVK